MIFEHCRQEVRPKEAARYWEIRAFAKSNGSDAVQSVWALKCRRL
jgi:hypothetical protein